jgi:hypothetical protein
MMDQENARVVERRGFLVFRTQNEELLVPIVEKTTTNCIQDEEKSVFPPKLWAYTR